jgi:glucan phosphoethanolaminetransferase (alkaline phosphatase superfamily)
MKQFGAFWLMLIVMLLLNIVYISIKLYKSNISKPMLAKSEITQAEFARLHTLSNYALSIESSFLIVLIITMIIMFSKKHKSLIYRSLVLLLSFLILLLAVNIVATQIFDAPIGNNVQLLFVPILLVAGVFIYVVLRKILPQRKDLRDTKKYN